MAGVVMHPIGDAKNSGTIEGSAGGTGNGSQRDIVGIGGAGINPASGMIAGTDAGGAGTVNPIGTILGSYGSYGSYGAYSCS